MRKLLSIILSIFLFAALASEGVMILTFKANQKQIIERYCVNKTKPEKKCEGKCFLNKIFKKKKTDDTQNSKSRRAEEPTRLFLFASTTAFLSDKIGNEYQNSLFYYPDLFPKEFHQSVFHPPEGILLYI